MCEKTGGFCGGEGAITEKRKLNVWKLPDSVNIGGKRYGIHWDFRDILEIFTYFQDPDLPDYLKWQIALALFYAEPVPEGMQQDAMEALAEFINGGGQETGAERKPLLDWQQDAALIVADVNKVAGLEIRSLPFLHWWTFLGYFHAIGEGQLSAVVAIRAKLQKGKKLEDWEKSYYRENRQLIEMKKRYSREELQEQARLQALLK